MECNLRGSHVRELRAMGVLGNTTTRVQGDTQRCAGWPFCAYLEPRSPAHAERPYPGSQSYQAGRRLSGWRLAGHVGRILARAAIGFWAPRSWSKTLPAPAATSPFDRIAKGPADGSQILIVPPGLATNQFLYAKLAFDPVADFVPLALVATIPNLLCVRNSLPVSSVPELIAFAKANPGQAHLRLHGDRYDAAPCDRDAQADGGPRFCHRALSRQRAGSERPAGGGRRSDVRQHHVDRYPCPLRQRQGARHLDVGTLAAGTGPFPDRRSVPGFQRWRFPASLCAPARPRPSARLSRPPSKRSARTRS